jgi:mannose-6-phosphate isomerase-like protein (cupin superfamily)
MSTGDPTWRPDRTRRVVVGLDGDGRSAVILDDVTPYASSSTAYPGVDSATLWKEPLQPDIASAEDQAAVYREIAVPTDGTRFYTVSIGPGVRTAMHETPTIEYHAVVSGAVTCLLDGEDVVVSTGDVLVMRGVSHGWFNHGDVPFVSAAVMIDAASSFPVR